MVLVKTRWRSWTIRAAIYLPLPLILLYAICCNGWPSNFQKQAFLQHCASTLRSAIDTNEIERACDKLTEARWLTNQPEAAVALKRLSTMARIDLDEFATILTNPKLATYKGMAPVIYGARLSNYSFTFWYDNKLPSEVRSCEKIVPDGRHLIMRADLYRNGKLNRFLSVSCDSNGVRDTESFFQFTEDGNLHRFFSDRWSGSFDGTNLLSTVDPSKHVIFASGYSHKQPPPAPAH